MSETQATGTSAVIRFTAGPDAGVVFELREEIVHIGRGADNDVRVTDPNLEEHEISIVARHGRYAIYASRNEFISVDGNLLPSERWVWLPAEAAVRMGPTTEFRFRTETETAGGSNGEAEGAEESDPGGSHAKSIPVPELPGKRSRPKKGGGQKPAESRRKKSVARFITDQVGDPLVKLGEDGTLPELHLAEPGESTKQRKARRRGAQTNPLLVYGAIGFSFLFSLMLLFLDSSGTTSAQLDQANARKEIQEFYGTEDNLKPYQILLREAQLARARNDSETEREYYRRVLNMLTAEDNQGLVRLTESRKHDERLRDLLAVLLQADD